MNDGPGGHELATALGGMAANLQNLSRDMGEVKADVKSFARFQATTEERLARGVQSFQDLDGEIGAIDQKVDALHDEHTKLKARTPRGWIVYAMLVVGFALVSFLVAFRGHGSVQAAPPDQVEEAAKNGN